MGWTCVSDCAVWRQGKGEGKRSVNEGGRGGTRGGERR